MPSDKICVIYVITNKLNGKIYIGKHWTDDVYDNYMGSGIVIKQAIKKYGKSNFTKEIIETTYNIKDSIEIEKYMIWLSNCRNEEVGYNISVGGDGFSHGINHPRYALGRKRSAESIAKMIESNAGFKHSEESKIKMSEQRKGSNAWNYGKKHKPETIEKMKLSIQKRKESGDWDLMCKHLSEIHTGKKMSDEAKENMKKNHKDYSGENHPLYGKTHNEESKIKMRESRKNYILNNPDRITKPFSEEARENMRIVQIESANKKFLFYSILMLESNNYNYDDVLKYIEKKLKTRAKNLKHRNR